MNEPVFKPGKWISFQKDDTTGGFGKIIGGYFDGTNWLYAVEHATSSAGTTHVLFDEIKYSYEGETWMVPNTIVGNSSVYAQVDEYHS